MPVRLNYEPRIYLLFWLLEWNSLSSYKWFLLRKGCHAVVNVLKWFLSELTILRWEVHLNFHTRSFVFAYYSIIIHENFMSVFHRFNLLPRKIVRPTKLSSAMYMMNVFCIRQINLLGPNDTDVFLRIKFGWMILFSETT